MTDAATRLNAWLATPFGHYVARYIEGGFAVFPVYGITEYMECTCGRGDCKNPGKHPASMNGLTDAVKDVAAAGALFNYREDLNIGIVCGEISDLLVLDIDPAKGGNESIAKLQELLGFLPPSPFVVTGSQGKHLLFNHPKGVRIPTSSDSFGKDDNRKPYFPGVDIRNNGGYVVWPPSRHKSGNYYTFGEGFFQMSIPNLPQGWIEYLVNINTPKKKNADVDRNIRSGNVPEWTEEDVRGMLAVLSPDMPYDDWLYVGMALHKEGFPLSMWDDWSSSQGSTKYKGIHELEKKWRSFDSGGDRSMGTIVDWARMRGWNPSTAVTRRHTDTSSVDNFVANLKAKMLSDKEPEEVAPEEPAEEKPRKKSKDSRVFKEADYIPRFSFNPIDLPGPIGDTVRWIVDHAIYAQPELALLNTLAFAGAVFGRKYASPVDTRTNVYMVGTARTGAGKEHSVRMIEYLSFHAGLSHHVGAHGVRSDIGILKSLMSCSSQLMALDEFGKLLEGLSSPTAGYNAKMISTLLTKLYSKSNSVYNHGDVGDERAKKLVIACPNLCIYGMSTESTYAPALRRSAIASGELNRFIAIPSRTKVVPRREVPVKTIDSDLLEWWQQFAPNAKMKLGEIVNSAMAVPTPTMVDWGECADRQYELLCEQTKLCDSHDDATSGLYSRLYENTVKVAMIFAIARDPKEPVFTHEDFDFAYSIVTTSIDYMNVLAEGGMAETQREVNHQQILKFIRESRAGVTRRDVLRRFRNLDKRSLEELIASMIEEEVVYVEQLKRHGSTTYVYHPVVESDGKNNNDAKEEAA